MLGLHAGGAVQAGLRGTAMAVGRSYLAVQVQAPFARQLLQACRQLLDAALTLRHAWQ